MNLKTNRIPIRTWSWLKVNDTTFENEIPKIKEFTKDPIKNIPKGIELERINGDIFYEIDGEEEFNSFIKENRNHGYKINIKAKTKVEEPLIINYYLDEENPTLVDLSYITVGEDSEVEIILNYIGESKVFHSGLTFIDLKDRARVKLIKLQLLNSQSGNIDFVRIVQGNDSISKTIIGELGSGETLGNWESNLEGDKASTELEMVYIGKDKEKLDFNYRMNHRAEDTRGKIVANGVLFDKSKKVFRDTIDFQRGSARSKSEETENILLLSDQAKNISVPLLLCVEDDVEGAHASITGSFDDKELFYIMSRGFSKEDAQRLLIEARLYPTLDRIDDEDIKNMAREFVQGRL